jgi:hypothetical protein
MLGSSRSNPGPLTTDTTQLLQQVAQNTSELLRWMKYLVAAVALLIVVTALLFV